MKHQNRLFISTSMAWLVLAACGTTFTKDAQDQAIQDIVHQTPTDAVKATVGKVLKIIAEPAGKPDLQAQERQAAIRMALAERFDFDEMARRSLATHWRDRSPQQRMEFVTCFKGLVEDFYVFTLESYRYEKIMYLGEQIDQDAALAKTKVITARSGEIPIDYRLIRHGETWRVYDVIVEGVSLISNYRVQFNKIIRTRSYPELVRLVCQGKALSAEDLLKTEPGESITEFATRVLPSNAKLVHEVIEGEFGPPGKNIVVLFDPGGCCGTKWTGWVLLPVQRGSGFYQRVELPPMEEIKGPFAIEVEAVVFANVDQDPERELIVLYHYYRTGSGRDEGNAASVYDWDEKGFRILENVSGRLAGLKSAAELRRKLGAISNR